jgi:hypothetical protein
MDGFGWVRFDPTPRGDGALPESITAEFDPEPFLPPPGDPNAAIVDRPSFLDESLADFDRIDDAAAGADGGDSSGLGAWIWLALPAVALLLALIPLLKSLRRRGRVRRLRQGDITAAWDEIVDRLADLGRPVPAHQTPIEFARSTDRSLLPLATSYSAAVYGDRNGHAHETDLVTIENWIKLRFEGPERALAAFNPRSLLDRD